MTNPALQDLLRGTQHSALPPSTRELLKLVQGIQPHDDRERQDLGDTLAWMASGAPLYRQGGPATPERHLVAYCAVVTATADRTFLLEHIKSGRWLPPGGHVDIDEDPFDAARRELQEETGALLPPLANTPLFCTVTETVGAMVPTHTDVSLWYAFVADAGETFELDVAECAHGRWFAAAELDHLTTTPDLARFMDKLNATLIAPTRGTERQ